MNRKVCLTEQQCFDRAQYMREHADELGIYFDPVKAEEPINLAQKYFRHWQGKLAPSDIVLAEFQIFILRELYGWFRKSDNTRLFRECLIHIPKKNAKSFIVSVCILYHVLMEKEYGGQVICSAPKSEQTRYVFETCQEFLKKSKPPFNSSKWAVVQERAIKIPKYKSIIRTISADSRLDGMNCSLGVTDEYQDSDERIYNSIKTSQIQRKQPLMILCGTAGTDVNGFGYSKYSYAKKIINPNHPYTDWSMFVYILEPDENWDLDSEETWLAINPLIPDAMSLEDFRILNQRSKQDRTYRPQYLQYHVNIWTAETSKTWIDPVKWSACAASYIEQDLYGCKIWLGIDMSKTSDLSCIVGLVEKDGKLYLLVWSFVPAEKLKQENEAPYQRWVDDGQVIVAGSYSINSNIIFSKIQEIAKNFRIQNIGFDRAYAGELVELLETNGFNYFEVNQSLLVFSEPTQQFENMIGNGEIKHNNNPCMNWQVANAEIKIINGLMKPVKEYTSSKHRIDAVISAIMSLLIYKKDQKTKSNDFNITDIFNLPDNFRAIIGI